MAELANLVKKRGIIKAQLTRFKTYFQAVAKPEEITQIKLRLSKLEDCWLQFENIQTEIELLDCTSDQPNEREKFESEYFLLTAAAQDFIQGHSLKQVEPCNIKPAIQPVAVKLPDIQLPTFNGSYDEWLSFRDTFVSLIHSNENMPSVNKFHYLKCSLKGEAKNTLSSLESSGDNYEIAWQLLTERYGNKRYLVNKHVHDLFNINKVEKGNSASLRSLLDNAQKHIRALKVLGQPTDNWDTLLIYLITSKLDFLTLREWENKQQPTQLPIFSDLEKFLNHKCQISESIETNKSQNTIPHVSKHKIIEKPIPKNNSFTSNYHVSVKKCCLCNEAHPIYFCNKFKSLSIQDREKEVRKLGLCFNCLSTTSHNSTECKASTCKLCDKRHNTLLHYNDNKTEITKHLTVASTSLKSKQSVLLSTALVSVLDDHGTIHLCRVLLDCGSQSNFITEKMARKLKLRKNLISSEISGIGQSTTSATYSVQCTVGSRVSSFSTTVECVVLPIITQELPTSEISLNDLNVPQNLQLADPNFCKPSEIDMLLGAELFFDILRDGTIKVSHLQPTFKNSVFGWIVSGKFQSSASLSDKTVCNLTVLEKIDSQLQSFWKIEDIDKPTKTFLEQNKVEQHFLQTFRRDSDGRFIVRLPLTEEKVLGNSEEAAITRFKYLEKKLYQNPEKQKRYSAFMKEYEELGHMVPLSEQYQNLGNNNRTFYLPHHCVTNEDSPTTKLRVVFDGSSKSSNGVSLNDIQMAGPVVQDELVNILLRFRQHKFVITADVEKMYRMIKVHEEDINLQRIVWRYSTEEELKHYCLTTVTYGTTSAPYLATRCLNQLAIDEQANFPKASNVTLSDFYVDDLLTGSDDIQSLLKIQGELIAMLRSGGFELKKWCSNSNVLLENVPLSHQHSNYVFHSDVCAIKTLGVIWEPSSDTFSFTIKCNKILQPITKRKILSQIASIFDPYGLLGPVILKAKLFLQRLWEIKIGWDDVLPEKIADLWCQYSEDLPNLKLLHLPRRVVPDNVIDIQLHGFADASETAYGACIYLRSKSENNEVIVKLLCSKSRVAPIKRVSIPRLELCAALLLAKLFQRVKSTLKITFSKCILWTDSTVVLCWINSSSSQWKPFVSNRVSEIQELTSHCQWRHVDSKDNPADLISRGLMPSQIIEFSLWWNGSEWLTSDEESWPNNVNLNSEETLERRIKPVVLICVNNDLLNKYSSYNKLLRVIAYCIRFKNNCMASSNDRSLGHLSHLELRFAEITCIKIVQRIDFYQEIEDLLNSHAVNNKSRLRTLNPFLDENGVIRVGGRIRQSNLTFDQKHPILLPGNHIVTKLIFKYEHVKQLHAGPSLLLASVRLRYWPLNGKNMARKVVHECIKCFRLNSKPTIPLMGDLPASRLQPQRPFYNCGVDFCGPLQIRSSKLRKSNPTKGYVAVFVCFSVKAVHLELVGDLTTESFLGALKRFMARRGKIKNIYSDNATNFTGANHELNQLKELFASANHLHKIRAFLSEDSINWNFIPPRAPHFGGLWEAAVKSCKYHLRRIVGNSVLTYEELNTYLTQVEACLNSRPITPLSNDPNDYYSLTPGHFLIGESLISTVEPDLTDIASNRLTRWQFVQQRVQHFWKRWSKEYLTSLQNRTKWTKDSIPLEEGTLVVVKEDNLPPLKWVLGRVINVHPGADNRNRVATIKTSFGIYKRPVVKLCPLPKED